MLLLLSLFINYIVNYSTIFFIFFFIILLLSVQIMYLLYTEVHNLYNILILYNIMYTLNKIYQIKPNYCCFNKLIVQKLTCFFVKNWQIIGLSLSIGNYRILSEYKQI